MIDFSRQASLLGEECQERLFNSSVFVAGVGALGCVVAELLVRAGIGTLWLTDFATVDPPDLNRQLLYTSEDLGKKKVFIAKEKLKRINPSANIFPIDAKIKSGFELPEKLDVVVDCLDNFESRFFLEELAWKRGIPLVHGGISRFFGQVTVVIPGETKRLSEVFKGAKDESHVPVVGYVPVVVGALQVHQVLNLLCNKPTLTNKLLILDLASLSIEEINLT